MYQQDIIPGLAGCWSTCGKIAQRIIRNSIGCTSLSCYVFHLLNRLHPTQTVLKPWPYELPALSVFVYEDAQLALLGVLIGDTLVGWILVRLGSGSAISSYSASRKLVTVLPSTQG